MLHLRILNGSFDPITNRHAIALEAHAEEVYGCYEYRSSKLCRINA